MQPVQQVAHPRVCRLPGCQGRRGVDVRSAGVRVCSEHKLQQTLKLHTRPCNVSQVVLSAYCGCRFAAAGSGLPQDLLQTWTTQHSDHCGSGWLQRSEVAVVHKLWLQRRVTHCAHWFHAGLAMAAARRKASASCGARATWRQAPSPTRRCSTSATTAPSLRRWLRWQRRKRPWRMKS